jgi:2-iminobutanoate/2-iminopropanoate deaminase
LLVIACVGQAGAEPPRKTFITLDGQRPTGLFANAIQVDKTLYIAGKGDQKPNEPTAGKVKSCLTEIQKTLELAGMSLNNVVQSFVYLEDHDQYAAMNETYGEFFPVDPPARTTLGVAQVPGDSRVEITCVAYADLSQKRRLGTPPPNRPYSPGIVAGDTVYVSGKVDQLPNGSRPATFEGQVRQAMKNVESTLKLAGLNFGHVVMSNVYLDSQENLEVAARVYGEFFERGNEPACATTFVNWIPAGSHVEVTCVATTNLGSRKVVRPASLKAGGFELAVIGSPAVWAGNTLYVSAIDGAPVLGEGASLTSVADQVERMAGRDLKILEEAGLTFDDVVSGSVLLADMKDYQGLNEGYKPFYSRGPAVRTCLMPSRGVEKSPVLVRASLIAARTR